MSVKDTILSAFDDKGTLLKWLKYISERGTITSIAWVAGTTSGKYKLRATFEDGTTVDSNEITIGSGGTTDFEDLTNRPKYAGTTMTGDTNIPDAKVTASGTEVTYNEGLTVDSDGDVEVGKDLLIDGSLKINDLTDLQDTEGNQLAYEILKGITDPTTSTAGRPGQIYINESLYKAFVCVNAASSVYTWVQINNPTAYIRNASVSNGVLTLTDQTGASGIDVNVPIANPTLAGTESNLTGMQVGNTKYSIAVKSASLSGTTLTLTI